MSLQNILLKYFIAYDFYSSIFIVIINTIHETLPSHFFCILDLHITCSFLEYINCFNK